MMHIETQSTDIFRYPSYDNEQTRVCSRMDLSSIDTLNDDILGLIFDYLHFDDKIRLRRTCKRWRRLIDDQLDKVRALRLGQFQCGGYLVTSGLLMKNCNHNPVSLRLAPQSGNRRRATGSLFNGRCLALPADPETQCFSVNQYDYLHRALKFSSSTITCLSLGRLNVTYRLLIVLTNNLPNLEHLELVACASSSQPETRTQKESGDERESRSQKNHSARQGMRPAGKMIPSLAEFNNPLREQQPIVNLQTISYNQHQNEQRNLEERLARCTMIKNCHLVTEAKRLNGPNIRHLLLKDCNLLSEFTLSLMLAITSQSLERLAIDSSQFLTGEFLNYCGPKLQQLDLRHCPLMQMKFLNDLVKLKRLVSATPECNVMIPNENRDEISCHF